MSDEKKNTGGYNTGDYNTGDCNTGDYNTGWRNTGDYNTGDYNTGGYNTGWRNTGWRNTGWRNTGDYNTGDYNTGNYNTGDYNTGDYNTGYFCTEAATATFFDTPCPDISWANAAKMVPSVNLPEFADEWIDASKMTEDEKVANPSYKTSGGYLRRYTLTIQQSFPKAWTKMSVEEKKKWLALPHFNADKFLTCTGVDVRLDRELFPQATAEPAPKVPQEIIVDGRRYVLAS